MTNKKQTIIEEFRAIKKALKDAGQEDLMLQKQISKELGITEQAVSSWFNNPYKTSDPILKQAIELISKYKPLLETSQG